MLKNFQKANYLKLNSSTKAFDDMKNFFVEIRDRLLLQIKPFNHVYVVYVFFFLIIVGGLGIWVSIYQESNAKACDLSNISFNISTYFIALVATAYIDVNINHTIENRLSLTIYSTIALLILIFMFYLSCVWDDWWGLGVSILGMIISLLMWHVGNSDSDRFSDETYNKRILDEARRKHGSNWS